MAPLLKFLLILGVQPPKFLYCSCFSKSIDLASYVLHCFVMMNFLTATWVLTFFLLLVIVYTTRGRPRGPGGHGPPDGSVS